MIICDKCKTPAEYVLTVDYRSHKNYQRVDFCEPCYNALHEWIHQNSAEQPAAPPADTLQDDLPRRRGRPPKGP